MKESVDHIDSILCVYVSVSNYIVTDEILNLSRNWQKHVMVVICIRMGVEKANPVRAIYISLICWHLSDKLFLDLLHQI